jgi:hypothetical protein
MVSAEAAAARTTAATRRTGEEKGTTINARPKEAAAEPERQRKTAPALSMLDVAAWSAARLATVIEQLIEESQRPRRRATTSKC